MRLKQSEILDLLIWVLIAFYTLIAHWIWVGRGVQENIIIILILIAIAMRLPNGPKVAKADMLLLCTLAVIAIMLAFEMLGGGRPYFLEDLKYMASGFVTVVYFCQMYRKQPERFRRYVNNSFAVLNVYTVVNTVIIWIQYFVPYFLMNRSAIAAVGNSLYFDQLCGFFGINGTTRWNLITSMIIIWNLSKAYWSKDNQHMCFAVVLCAISMLTSIINGSRAFLVVIIVLLGLFCLLIGRDSITSSMKIVSVILLTGCLLYLSVPLVQQYINDLILDKFHVYTMGDVQKMLSANDDRIDAVYYAWQTGGAWGKGLGSIPMHTSVQEAKHLGLNSTSSYIYMLGYVRYFIYCIIIGTLIASSMHKKIKKTKLCRFLFAVVCVIFSFLLPVFSSIVLMAATCITLLILAENEMIAESRKRTTTCHTVILQDG